MTLQSEMVNDYNTFLADFGVTVLYTATGENQMSITGIFDADYPADNGDGIITFTPKVRLKSTDISNPAKGEEMIINNLTYYIFEPLPAIDGFTDILLTRDS